MFRAARAGLALVLVLCVSSPAWAEEDPHRLTDSVEPTHQAIQLTLDPDRMDYEGSVQIHLTVHETVDHFRFHAEDMKFARMEVRSDRGTLQVTHERGEADLVTVTPESSLAPGNYVFHVDFTNHYDTTGTSLYRAKYEGNAYLFTQFEASDARGAFPCLDEPKFKITWDMTITTPAHQVMLFNTPVKSETVDGDDKILVYETSLRMPSYLVAIAAGPLEAVPMTGMGVPGNVYTPKGKTALARHAAEITPKLLAALEAYFGRPYPYKKLDQVAVPEFWPGAMENVGLITYRDTILLIDDAAITVSQQRRQAEVVAHELAHQWFGNLVTMKWWDDLWLNESFASWCGTKITDQVFPEFGLAVTSVRGAATAMSLDSQVNTRAVRQPVKAAENLEQLADALAYQKGEAVLGMFESFVGEETFREGILTYIEDNAWENAAADDLWAALSKSTGVDIGSAMATFLDQPGVPLVRANPLGDGRVEFTQERFLNYGANLDAGQTWSIPVVFKYEDNGNVKTQRVMLTEASQVVELTGSSGEPQWLHPNADENGYYHWSLEPDALVQLVEGAGERLGPRERVGLVAQVSALLDNGELSGGQYLRAASALVTDEAPQVVDAGLNALGKVRGSFVTAELRDAFAGYVSQTLGPVLDRYGISPRADEDESIQLLRPDLINWLGKYGRDARVREYASEVAQSYLEGDRSGDASVAAACLSVAALEGDWKYYNQLKTAFEGASVPADRGRFLSAMGNFENQSIANAALHYSVSGEPKPQELFQIPMGVGTLHSEEGLVWTWFQQNYQTLRGMIPDAMAVYLPYFATSCLTEQLASAEAFFAMPAHTVPGQEKEFAKVAEGTNDCAALREREKAAVAEYLQGFSGMQ